jgi:hypothetical protein
MININKVAIHKRLSSQPSRTPRIHKIALELPVRKAERFWNQGVTATDIHAEIREALRDVNASRMAEGLRSIPTPSRTTVWRGLMTENNERHSFRIDHPRPAFDFPEVPLTFQIDHPCAYELSRGKESPNDAQLWVKYAPARRPEYKDRLERLIRTLRKARRHETT